jgi:hypothetical protein
MASDSDSPPPRPDWALVANPEMADGGPRYTETPADPFAPGGSAVAEPWNAATASLFVALVAVWAWRLRGRYREFPFLCCCLPVLLAGGVGGTLYHATRTRYAYFLLDVVPISVLGLAGAVFVAVRFWGRRGWWYVPGAAAFYVAVNALLFNALDPGRTLAVNLSYAALALVVVLPVSVALVRTRFRHGGWFLAGLVAFVIAWCFRLIDLRIGALLPMGSHWLWHLFGCAATALLIEYFYRVEGERRCDPPGICDTSGPRAER